MKKLAFFVAATAATAAALWLRRKITPAVSPLSAELGVSLPVPPPAQEIHGPSPVEIPLKGDNGLNLVCTSVHLQEDGELISEFMPANHEDKGEAVGHQGGEEHVKQNDVPEDQDIRGHLGEDDDCNMDHLGVEAEEEENVGHGKEVPDVLHEEDGLGDTAEGAEEHLEKIVQARLENKDEAIGQEGRDEDRTQDVADDQDLSNALEKFQHVLAEEDGLVEGVEGGEICLEDENKNHDECIQDDLDGDAEHDGVRLVVLGEGRIRNCEVDVLNVPGEEDSESDDVPDVSGEDDNESGFMFDHLSKAVMGAEICLEDENKNQKGVHDDCNMHHLDVEAEVNEEDAGQGEEVRDVLPEEDGLVEVVESRDICLVDENKNHGEGVQDGFSGDGECDVVQLVVIAEEGEGSLEDHEVDIVDVTPGDDDDSAFMFDHLRDVTMAGEVYYEDENKNCVEGVQDELPEDDNCDVEPLVEDEGSLENCEAGVLYVLGEEEAAIGGEVCTIREDEIQGGFKDDNECVACLTVPAEGKVITADREADGEEGENIDCSQCGMAAEKVVQDGCVDVHQQTTSARESYVPDWKKRNPFLMDQIKALNMKTRQIKAARSYTIGPMDHNDQHARMKEIALRRAKELEEEEKERTRMKKARSLAKLEELNTRILTQSSHENHQFSSRLQVYPRRN